MALWADAQPNSPGPPPPIYITGNTLVDPSAIGFPETYYAHVNISSPNDPPPTPNITWSVSLGTIISQGIDLMGNYFCTISWDQGLGLGQITAHETTQNIYAFLTVQIGVPVISPANQTVLYGTSPTPLCISYGSAIIYGYMWEMSTDNINWTTVANLMTPCYQPPAASFQLAYYRCQLQLINGTVYSPVASIDIPPLTSGSISTSNPNPPYNNTIVFNSTPATGGMCLQTSYLYAWEVSYNGTTWQIIGTGESFPFSYLQVTEDFSLRRKVTCGGQTLYSNTLFINVGDYSGESDGIDNLNFIREYTIIKKGATSWYQATTLAMGDKLVTTTFLDGLGRPLQTVDKRASSVDGQTWKNMVKHYEYDAAGRVVKDFIPYPSISNPGGGYHADAATEQPAFIRNFFGESSTAPTWSETVYDNSPLNRIMKTMRPGQSWAGSNIGVSAVYDFNYDTEKVHIWNLDYSNSAIPSTSLGEIYATGKLSKNLDYDEQNNKVITYSDMGGNVILKKVQEASDGPGLTSEHTGWVCTYYVYDDFGQLRYIVPPKAVKYLDETGNWNLTQNITDELCFKYVYDEKGRMIIKKQPGAGEISLVYDKKDRLVLSQDANQKVKNQWSFSLYDDLNRTVATGLFDNTADRAVMQAHVNTNLNNGVVSVYPWVRNGVTIELKLENPIAGNSGTNQYCNGCNAATLTYNSITHYDDYSFAGAQTFNTNNVFAYNAAHPFAEPTVKTSRSTGMITGEKIRVLDGDNNPNNDKFTFSTAYYDERGRSLQNLAENISLNIDYSTNQYDFSGKLLSSYVNHTYNVNYTVTSKAEFDKMGRLIKGYKNFNNTFYKQLAEYTYDELGQIKTKRIAPGYTATGKNEIESFTYDYNIQGWLTSINKDYALSNNNYSQWDKYFGMYLGYDNKDGQFVFPLLNGNITGTIWKSQGDNSPRKYDYTYDRLDRFTSAIFNQKKKPTDGWTNSEVDLSVYMEYEDGNGNIKSMKHMGIVPGINNGVTIDDLRYAYKPVTGVSNLNGNKLGKVNDVNTSLGINNGLLGDFKDGTNTSDDYEYDINGNLVKDFNKNIISGTQNGITYNFLNKPEKVVITGKSTIDFIYDATGYKLKKTITYANNSVRTTTYIGDFIYEQFTPAGGPPGNDELQYVVHEEGRVKIITPHAQTNVIDYELNTGSFGITWPGGKQGVFEYFLKDHLGSTRMVLTEEVQKEFYEASMEFSVSNIEAPLFGAVDGSGQPTPTNELNLTRMSGSPWPGNTTDVAKLTAADPNRKIGPNMILKVMAGDIINSKVDYFYFNNNPTGGGNPVQSVLTSLTGALSTVKTGVLNHNSSVSVNTNLTNNAPFNLFINNQPATGNPNAPKAYLNIIFLDEQFKFIDKDYVTPEIGSDYLRVNSAGTPALLLLQKKAPKNGWVFVYLSNESNENVYFDNLAVNQEHSRIAEESHYYPFGLKIAGISSKAFNKLQNKHGYQGDFSEEETETGWDEFDLRMYDPQIGRWNGVDPYDEFTSPYIGMGNNPINQTDPSGGKTDDWLYNNRTNQYEWFDDVDGITDFIDKGYWKQGYTFDFDRANGDFLVDFAGTNYLYTSNGEIGSLIILQGVTASNKGSSGFLAGLGNSILSLFEFQAKFVVSPLWSATETTIDYTNNLSNVSSSNSFWTNARLIDPTGSLNTVQITRDAISGDPYAQGQLTPALFSLFVLRKGTTSTRIQATKGGVQYTKSSLALGREMHTAYKAGVADGVTTFKEFTKVRGIRPDFVDFGTKTIYELKPFNPRQIQLGTKQLNNYKSLFEQKYGGTWNTILEHY
jgi:RHS repeat-associated protein